MTAIRKDDIARMRDQRQRREARKAALHPLAVRRYTQLLLWGTLVVDPREETAAVAGLPEPHPLPWGAPA
jgi:hypothetical protein